MKEIPFLQLLSTAVTTIKVCRVDFYTIRDAVVKEIRSIETTVQGICIFLTYSRLAMTRKARNI